MKETSTIPQTVLVTGGGGFLASWTIAELLRRGHAVRTTVRSLAKKPQLRAQVGKQVDPGDHLSIVVADLTAHAGWDAAVAGCGHVLHIAAPGASTRRATLTN